MLLHNIVTVFNSVLYYFFSTAVVEGRGLAKGEIGMASIDLKRPELVLSQVQYYINLISIRGHFATQTVLKLSGGLKPSGRLYNGPDNFETGSTVLNPSRRFVNS